MNLNQKHIYRVYFDETIPDPPQGCFINTITVTVPEDIVFTYYPCGGGSIDITLNSEGIASISPCCSQKAETNAPPSTKWSIVLGDECTV